MNKDREIEMINKNIRDLVYEKVQLKKAYNYYHCLRDAEQFRHIEDNYGIGTPTSIGFTPLIKKHIDVLVGEYLELDPDLQVTCKDDSTCSNIMRDKQLEIIKQVFNYLNKKLMNTLIDQIINKKQTKDPFVQKEIEDLMEDINKNYVSQYEIAAQNILLYIRQSRDIDIKNKMRELFTDLLVTGCCYYRTRAINDNIQIEILNPVDTFIERNRTEFFLNKSPRCVIRRWLNEDQILAEYGDELSEDAKKRIKDEVGRGERSVNTVYVRTAMSTVDGEGVVRKTPTPGILGGLEVTPVFPWNETGMYNYQNTPIMPVYETEWLEYDKKQDKMVRHEGVRIGEDIFITRGESKYVTYSSTNRQDCELSLNGMFFSDKNGSPFSIVLSTADLQDKYDLLIFYRDNLIATSGTTGDWLDMATLPSNLGVTFPEKVQKWIAYKKNGIALYDSSQEGAQVVNTTFNGYDDTVKAQSIQAIQIAIESVEAQAASITGVYPQKLGEIQQRDAVSNVKVGIHQSSLITKQYFNAMDLMYREANYDLLNLAKQVYKNGLHGTIILGNKLNKIFTALPEYYTLTDFDIHIQDSSEVFQTKETLKQMSLEMVKGGFADPEFIIKILLGKNITEIKSLLNETIKEKKKENDQIQQMQQQLQQADQMMKDYEKQIKELNNKNQQLQASIDKQAEQKLAIERAKLDIERSKIDNTRDYNDKIIDNKNQQLKLQMAELSDNNPYNDKIYIN